MNKIDFQKTNHVFLDNGIVALYRYLLPRQAENIVQMSLSDYQLTIQADDLSKILEDVYYEMGKAVYDTVTKKQLDEMGNIYFDSQTLEPHLFPKMNTYGFTELLTNNAQGGTRYKENSTKFDVIEAENPERAARIKNEFKKLNIPFVIKKTPTGKISYPKIYFNEPYTKLTRLIPLEKAYLEIGDKYCYLTGEGYQKLVDSQNISPFLSGLTNFNSNLAATDKKVSWKTLYLSRFAAAQCLYAYNNRSYETLYVFFFGANSLKQLVSVYDKHIEKSIRYSQSLALRAAWQTDFFVKNFQLYDVKDGFCGQSEFQFMLLYTIFRQIIQKTIDEAKYSESDLLFAIDDSEFSTQSEIPYLIALRAATFASTKRPNAYEVMSHLKYVMALFCHLEHEKFDADSIKTFLRSLKIIKPSLAKAKDAFERERATREVILKKILRADSILEEVEQIFYDCYRYLSVDDPIGFKNFHNLKQFIVLYESHVHIKKMSKELQKKAIDFGYSIGKSMVDYEGGNPANNARQSRKYIIDLRNSRTYEAFLEALNRLSSRFGTNFKHEFAEQLDENNFRIFKSFLTLGMFNVINPILQPKKEAVAK